MPGGPGLQNQGLLGRPGTRRVLAARAVRMPAPGSSAPPCPAERQHLRVSEGEDWVRSLLLISCVIFLRHQNRHLVRWPCPSLAHRLQVGVRDPAVGKTRASGAPGGGGRQSSTQSPADVPGRGQQPTGVIQRPGSTRPPSCRPRPQNRLPSSCLRGRQVGAVQAGRCGATPGHQHMALTLPG